MTEQQRVLFVDFEQSLRRRGLNAEEVAKAFMSHAVYVTLCDLGRDDTYKLLQFIAEHLDSCYPQPPTEH